MLWTLCKHNTCFLGDLLETSMLPMEEFQFGQNQYQMHYITYQQEAQSFLGQMEKR